MNQDFFSIWEVKTLSIFSLTSNSSSFFNLRKSGREDVSVSPSGTSRSAGVVCRTSASFMSGLSLTHVLQPSISFTVCAESSAFSASVSCVNPSSFRFNFILPESIFRSIRKAGKRRCKGNRWTKTQTRKYLGKY